MGVAGGPDMIQDGLVLALDASDRNSYVSGSSVWRDLSGLNNTGSLVNGPTFSSANQGSIVFDGTNDYVGFGNISSIILSNNQFCINYWLLMTGTARGDFFNIKNFNTPQDDIGFFIDTNNKLYTFFLVQGALTNNGGATNNRASVSNTTFSRNVIYNVCIQKEASQKIGMYVNGVIDNNTYSTTTNTANVASTSLWVGSNKSNDTTVAVPWPGNIYNVKVYNRALSATEILQNYNATKTRFGL